MWQHLLARQIVSLLPLFSCIFSVSLALSDKIISWKHKHHTEKGWLNILSPNLVQELTPLPFSPHSSASKAPFGSADASYVHNLPLMESSSSLLLLLLPLN